jgi:hypothetical protein
MQQLSTTKISIRQVISNTTRSSGPIGLYKGIDSMLLFAAPKAGVRFCAKEKFSKILEPYNMVAQLRSADRSQ